MDSVTHDEVAMLLTLARGYVQFARRKVEAHAPMTGKVLQTVVHLAIAMREIDEAAALLRQEAEVA